jgi:ubiquinone/menaquinone biosynthesis C-methylase UbiE
MLPVTDGWADVVISNGVINLCADKQAVFAEIYRVLRPGGQLGRSALAVRSSICSSEGSSRRRAVALGTSWHTWRTGTPARSAAARM